MIDSVTVGVVKEAFRRTKSVREASESAGISWRTAKRIIDDRFKPRTYKKRAAKKENRTRAKKLVSIASRVSKKGHLCFPTFGSSSKICFAYQAESKESLSARQVRRILRKEGLRPFSRQRTPTRVATDLRARRGFRDKCLKMSDVDLRRICFSDESWLSANERTSNVQWSRNKKSVLPLERKCRWNTPSVMIWACVGDNYKSDLVILPSRVNVDGEPRVFRLDSKTYVRRCLTRVVGDLKRKKKIFQQDGARSHAAGHTKQYLRRKGVELLEGFPAYSPDLNMIEALWKDLHERVGGRVPLTQDELVKVAREEWKKMPQSLINNHVRHFKNALRKV